MRSSTGVRCLFEFGHYFVHFIVWIATGTAGVHCFTTVTTGASLLIQKWVLGGTGAFKFSVFQKDQPYRHQNEKQRQKS